MQQPDEQPSLVPTEPPYPIGDTKISPPKTEPPYPIGDTKKAASATEPLSTGDTKNPAPLTEPPYPIGDTTISAHNLGTHENEVTQNNGNEKHITLFKKNKSVGKIIVRPLNQNSFNFHYRDEEDTGKISFEITNFPPAAALNDSSVLNGTSDQAAYNFNNNDRISEGFKGFLNAANLNSQLPRPVIISSLKLSPPSIKGERTGVYGDIFLKKSANDQVHIPIHEAWNKNGNITKGAIVGELVITSSNQQAFKVEVKEDNASNKQIDISL